MNAADLAAQIVAGARVAEVIEARRKEFQILEVSSSALMVDCDSRESAAHTLNRSQGKLQSLLSEGWKIETQLATSCLIPAREECAVEGAEIFLLKNFVVSTATLVLSRQKKPSSA